MHRLLVLLIGLLSLSLLGYFCIYYFDTKTKIQADIDSRVRSVIKENELSNVMITTHGRNIVLNGEVEFEKVKIQAGNLAKNVYGVHEVDNRITVVNTKFTKQPELKSEVDAEPQNDNLLAPKLEPLPNFTCQQDFDFILQNEKIQFAINSSEIEATSYPLLDNLVDIAKQCAEARIEIAGHSDSQGDDKNNLHLSQARATSVMEYLVNKGIASSRLTAVGFGESKPIANNDTEKGRAANRRIEINVEVIE